MVIDKKPKDYPYVTVEIAEMAVGAGYPPDKAFLNTDGKILASFVILSYQELIDWFRDTKGIHLELYIPVIYKKERWSYELIKIKKNEVLTREVNTWDNYYEAQHHAIINTFKLLE